MAGKPALRVTVNQETQNGSYRLLVIPRWSAAAESAQLARTSRSWARVSQAAH